MQFDPVRHNDGYHVAIKKIEPERSRHSRSSQISERREHWSGKNNMDTPENGCIEQGKGALDGGFIDEPDIPQDWKDCDDSNDEVEFDV